MKFIKCSERLPKKGKKVLFKLKNGSYHSGHIQALDKSEEYSDSDGVIRRHGAAIDHNYFPVSSGTSLLYRLYIINSWADLPKEEE